MADYDIVVCGECGKGDWSDFEPGDTLRCPYCENRAVLVWLSEYNDE